LRSKEERIAAVPHIAYERVALALALEDFVKRGRRRFDLEAALIHARNLTDFFWLKTTHCDGVYARHYDETWGPGSHSQLPSMRYDAMSAQLAHISTRRSTAAENLTKEIADIAGDLQEAWNRWRGGLDGTEWDVLLDAWVKHWQDEAEKSLGRDSES
jgi:hypothetical protein